MATHYDVLGVMPSASSEEIKKAYRRQSMTSHPDRNRADPSATGRFQSIGKAFAVLGDEDQRRSYDMSIQSRTRAGADTGGDHPYGSFANAFVQGRPQPHYGREPSPSFLPQTIKPPSIEVNLEISLSQAYAGCTESVSVKRWIAEGGSGQREEKETLYVTVPKGADDGEILVLESRGHCSPEGVSGDVKVFLSVANDSEFRRRGLDLVYEHTISLREALCGFSFELRHVSGKSLTIQNPRGSIVTPSYRKIVPELGMQREEHAGNMVIDFKVVFPSRLDSEVVDQLESLL